MSIKSNARASIFQEFSYLTWFHFGDNERWIETLVPSFMFRRRQISWVFLRSLSIFLIERKVVRRRIYLIKHQVKQFSVLSQCLSLLPRKAPLTTMIDFLSRLTTNDHLYLKQINQSYSCVAQTLPECVMLICTLTLVTGMRNLSLLIWRKWTSILGGIVAIHDINYLNILNGLITRVGTQLGCYT